MTSDKLIRGGKAWAGALLCCLALGGCLRNEIDDPGTEQPSGHTYGLGLVIAADALVADDAAGGEYRYGNDAENYIDPAKLRLLFLDKEGNFKFEMSNLDYPGIYSGLQLEPLRMTSGNAVSQWFVRIPVDELKQEHLDLITDEGFKVAVMANWPDEAFWGDGQKSVNTNFLEEGSEQNIVKRLAHCHYDERYTQGMDEVLEREKNGAEDDEDEVITTFESYRPFLGLGADGKPTQMGVSIDWVHSWYTDNDSGINEDYTSAWVKERNLRQVAAAEKDIRERFSPYPKDSRPYLRKSRSRRLYHDLWYIWNFGGSLNSEDDSYFQTPDKKIRNAWIERNDKDGWAKDIQAIVKDGQERISDSSLDIEQLKEEEVIVYNDPNGGLKTGVRDHTRDYGERDGIIFASKGSDNYTAVRTPHGIGVMMPRIGEIWKLGDKPGDSSSGAHFQGENVFDLVSAEEIEAGGSSDKTFGYWKLPLAADGNLRFKVAVICGNDIEGVAHNVAVGIHCGNIGSYSSSEGKKTNYNNREALVVCKQGDADVRANHLTDMKTLDYEVKITERTKDTYIYALCENKNDRLVIYEIEYIKNQHLSDIERDGVQPSKENPLPMYGIQDFDPIGEYWTPGELFNLSAYTGFHSDQYNYRWISLLRSVAKVELKIAKAPFRNKKPSYLYMRSMNRTARLNPIDVLTPTDQIWYGSEENGIAGIFQETKNIQAYEPMFEGDEYKGGTEKKGKLDYFHKRMAWFFKIWTDEDSGIGWKWNDFPISIDDKGLAAPRVFNPHINRSDYTAFNYLGEDSEYWYYSLYMPERQVTDPNNAGDLTEDPKCQRIEMRWDGVNEDLNLDDNASYRIYFIDPASNIPPVGSYDRDGYENVSNAFEFDVNNLRAFYPIVRNHLYQVTVSGINGSDVTLKVRTPASRQAEIVFN